MLKPLQNIRFSAQSYHQSHTYIAMTWTGYLSAPLQQRRKYLKSVESCVSDATTATKENARLKRLRGCILSDEKTVALNGMMKLPYCDDTDADRTAVSRAYVDELMLRDPTVTMIRLATPVVNTTVAKHEITCTDAVYLRLLILLIHTAAGPAALHKPVEFLVIDGDEPEFILGHDILEQLGIDIDRQLEQLARYVDDEDDDLEDFSAGVPGSGPATTDNALREAVEKVVQIALQNGFPRRSESILRHILLEHDVWRRELENDPLAKVKP
ncbi:unnamed protein product [Phytophthora fragariaefolia]|uniref:Unnamed protein product n=1 Tax=Phytophthora fragariaefolia TaxID=1490495 RepID=A0A9W6XTJ3_9STRA|nr:unnamed protein product [Phytophthora fragariaefolia]